jgi:hypothetical protein
MLAAGRRPPPTAAFGSVMTCRFGVDAKRHPSANPRSSLSAVAERRTWRKLTTI